MTAKGFCSICEGDAKVLNLANTLLAQGNSANYVAVSLGLNRHTLVKHMKHAVIPNKSAVPVVSDIPTSKLALSAERIGITVLHRVESLVGVLEQQAAECVNDKDRRNLCATAAALTSALTLAAKITGEMPTGSTQVQVNTVVPKMEMPPLDLEAEIARCMRVMAEDRERGESWMDEKSAPPPPEHERPTTAPSDTKQPETAPIPAVAVPIEEEEKPAPRVRVSVGGYTKTALQAWNERYGS